MLKNFRDSPTLAHVLPLAVFTAMLSMPGWFKIENRELPWLVQMPELWVYPLQTIVCATLLIFFRHHYRLLPWCGIGLAVLFAVLGIGFWIAPELIRRLLIDCGYEAKNWWGWIGLADRSEGFDPMRIKDVSLAFYLTLGFRFVRLVLVVPLVEELFWRGFLMRFLVDPDRSFTAIPFGAHRWKAFWCSNLAVMLIHSASDWLGAFIWSTFMYFLAVRTKSLGACVIMHAVGNLLLGLYIMKTSLWGYW